MNRPGSTRSGLFLAACSGCLLCSCVATSGDLRRLADRQETMQAEIKSAIESVAKGETAFEVFGDVVTSSLAKTAVETRAVAADADRRAKDAALSAVEIGSYLLLGGGATGAATYRVTNALRDRKRRRRGEPTA